MQKWRQRMLESSKLCKREGSYVSCNWKATHCHQTRPRYSTTRSRNQNQRTSYWKNWFDRIPKENRKIRLKTFIYHEKSWHSTDQRPHFWTRRHVNGSNIIQDRDKNRISRKNKRRRNLGGTTKWIQTFYEKLVQNNMVRISPIINFLGI